MSKTDDSVAQFRDHISPPARDIAGVARRMGIGHSIGVLWQVTGHTLMDKSVETRDAEPFTNVGFYSRPKHDNNASEAIVLFIGGSENPIIIATRDESRRAAVAQIESDETVMHNSQVRILIKQDGTVEIGLPGDTMKPVALKSDVDDLWNKYNHHTHPDPQGGVTGLPDNTGGPASGSHILKVAI